jgi:hypothetical protein
MIDIDKLRSLVQSLYQPLVSNVFGTRGTDILSNLVQNIRLIYKHVSPEHCTKKITIFQYVNSSDELQVVKKPIVIYDVKNINSGCATPFVIQIAENGGFLIWNNYEIDPMIVSQKAIVYTFEDHNECIFAGGQFRELPRLHHSRVSCFAEPMFYELRDALEYYKTSFVRHSSCIIFSSVWNDKNRIYFKHAQEFQMRRSLTQFLKCYLRGDVEVRPEQIVDESHPVDIKVTWHFANRLALIEIKWLGTPHDGTSVGKPSTPHRARSGAKQLADYLDANKVQAPIHTTRGYLVVIDGRRRGIDNNVTTISRKDGHHYANTEIDYNPQFHTIRDDFDTPIRMFAEPICN